MGIEKIKGNIEGITSPRFSEKINVEKRAYLGTINDTTSFTGAAKPPKDLTEMLIGLMPNKIKWMVKLHKNMGEIQNQAINALGTGLVAPMLIKYNPISNTDKDTRTYTAWRQPVSAILAVATQCAIVIPFNKAIKNMSDIGYEHLSLHNNASLFPSDDYLKALVKSQNPGVKFTKEELQEKVDALKKANDNALKKMITDENNITFKKTGTAGVVSESLSKDEFKNLFNETLNNIIKAEEEEKYSLIDKKLSNKLKRSIFYHEHGDEAKNTLQTILDEVKRLSPSENNATTPAQAYKRFNQVCNSMIKDLKKEAQRDPSKTHTNSELISIVKELKQKNIGKDPAVISMLQQKIEKMLNNIDIIKTKKDTKEVIEYVNQLINMRAEAIDTSIATLNRIKTQLNTSGITVQEAQKIIDDTINASEASLTQRLSAAGRTPQQIAESIEMTESVATRLKQKASSVAGCIGDQMKKVVKSNIDGLKRWTGLGVSLAILPLTCWLLNKLYPKFMDFAFPELSNKQNAKKQAEKEALNNNKTEVA